MEYRDALARIHGLVNYDSTGFARDRMRRDELKLERVRSVLRALGSPERGRHTVHVAGSKGKGSTAAMTAAILRAHGLHAGLFTSPHLHTFRERIAVDGEKVSEERFAALVDEAWPVATAAAGPGERLTFFEVLTVMGFLEFRRAACDWQVVEVGLGGRLDATNVLDAKEVCAITPLSLEHTQILGDRLEQIAGEKAGILRPGVSCVLAPQRPAAAERVAEEAARLGCPLHAVTKECRLRIESLTIDGSRFTLQTPAGRYRLPLPLLGRHQVENAATAVRICELALGEALRPELVARGLAGVRWPGRLEALRRSAASGWLLVDGAHNADSARRVAETVAEVLPGRPVHLVLGVMRDKDVAGIAGRLAALDPQVYAVAPRLPRALPAEELAAACRTVFPGRTPWYPSVEAGLQAALAAAAVVDGVVLVCGSLFTAAEAREAVLGILPDLVPV